MSGVDLWQFCHVAAPYVLRGWLLHPFMVDGDTVATDGWILVRCDGIHTPLDTMPPKEATERATRVLTQFPFQEGFPLPQAPAPAGRCSSCNGQGYMRDPAPVDDNAEFEPCGPDAPGAFRCSICRGDGDAGMSPIDIGLPKALSLAWVNYRRLRTLPGLLIDVRHVEVPIGHWDAGAIAFRFDGGTGVVMPMKFDSWKALR